MKTVSIRELRGASLRQSARKGELLAITNHRVLIGVVVPVVSAWVEHVIESNWSHVRQSIAEGEQSVADSAVQGLESGNLEQLAPLLVAAVVGGTVAQSAESGQVLRRLQSVLSVPEDAPEEVPGEVPEDVPEADDKPSSPQVRTVRVGLLSAELIEEAGAAGETLAVTHDRELIAIVIPVTSGLVQFLIEQNMGRVLSNIRLGEKQLRTADGIGTLGIT